MRVGCFTISANRVTYFFHKPYCFYYAIFYNARSHTNVTTSL